MKGMVPAMASGPEADSRLEPRPLWRPSSSPTPPGSSVLTDVFIGTHRRHPTAPKCFLFEWGGSGQAPLPPSGPFQHMARLLWLGEGYLWPWAAFMWSRMLMACLRSPSTLRKCTPLSTRLFTALWEGTTLPDCLRPWALPHSARGSSTKENWCQGLSGLLY